MSVSVLNQTIWKLSLLKKSVLAAMCVFVEIPKSKDLPLSKLQNSVKVYLKKKVFKLQCFLCILNEEIMLCYLK